MTWISIPQFAKLQGVKKPYIYALLDSGKIPESATKLKKPGGKHKLINIAEAEKAIKSNVRTRNSIKPKSKQREAEPRPKSKQKKKAPPKLEPTEAEQQKVIDEAGLKIFDTLTEAQKFKETYAGARQKLEYEKEKKLLINAEDVKKDAERAARIVKERVTAWPGRTAPLVAPVSDVFEVEQILKRESDQLLEEISKAVLDESL